jgi:HAE1 family hydrophobic/amphiphilic exporter-1
MTIGAKGKNGQKAAFYDLIDKKIAPVLSRVGVAQVRYNGGPGTRFRVNLKLLNRL